MTEIQEKLVELLDEINAICIDKNLMYSLSAEPALNAFRSHKFESDVTYLNIYMTLPDALILQEEIIKKNMNYPMIESLYTNDYFPNLIFRYCNKNTLYISLKGNSEIKSLGIAVKIIILRRSSQKFSRKVITVLERGWMFNCIDYPSHSLTPKRKVIKNITGIFIKISRKGYKKILLNLIEKFEKNVDYEDELYTLPFRGKIKHFSKNTFDDLQLVLFEGKKYPIPIKIENIFKPIYGLRWKNTVFNKQEVNENTIIDPNLPFQYYLDYLKMNNISLEFHEDLMHYKNLKIDLMKYNKIINRAWYYVLRTGARFSMWEKYFPQKEYIIDLYNQKKWEKLKKVLDDYDQVVQKNFKRKLVVCFDEEIFKIYIELLNHYEEFELAKKLVEMVPEKHFEKIIVKN